MRCRGQDFKIFTSSTSWVSLVLETDQKPSFPDEIGRGRQGRIRWIKVPKAAVERMWNVRQYASWRGHEVAVEAILAERARVSFLGDIAFAVSNGLSGNMHDGWGGLVPIDELTESRVEIEEMSV